MSNDSSTSALLPRPRIIGRLLRFVFGVLMLITFANLVRAVLFQAGGFFAAQHGWSIPDGDWWVAALACLCVLPVIINSGFSRRWGDWPRLIFLCLAAVAVLWDWLGYGSFWAMPLALLVFLLVAYVLAHAGVSLLVAAFVATPG